MLRRLLLLGALIGLTGCDTYAVTDGDCPAGEVLGATGCAIPCVGDNSCADGTICLDGSCAEGVRPAVTTYSPLDGADAVAVDAEVVVTFSIPMEPLSATGAFSLTRNTVVQAGAVNWSAGDLTLTFTPAADLSPGVIYVAEVSTAGLSADGIPLETTFRTTFTTDAPPVAVLSMDPVPGSTGVGVRPIIALTFTVPMEPVSTAQAFSLIDSASNPVGGNATLDPFGTTLTFSPGPILANNEVYAVAVATTAVAEIGVPLDSAYQASFTTTAEVDAFPPSVAIDPVGPPIIGGAHLDGVSAFEFTGSATDSESSIDNVTVQVVPAGSGATGSWAPATITTPGANATWSYRWFPGQIDPLPDGSYTLFVRAIDKGGNEQQTSLTVAADLVPPATPTWAVGVPSRPKRRVIDVSISGEVNALLEVLVDGVMTPESPVPLGPAGVATTPITLDEVGTHAIAVIAIDAVGNRNDTPLVAVIERIGWRCLTPGSGFPPLGATVISLTIDEDLGIGEVFIDMATSSCHDTYISNLNQGTNYGSDDELRLSADERILLRAGQDWLWEMCGGIQVMEFILYESADYDATDDIEVFTAERQFNEGDATWTRRLGSNQWMTPGGYTVDYWTHVPHGKLVHHDGPTAQEDYGVVDVMNDINSINGSYGENGYILMPGTGGASAVFHSANSGAGRVVLHMVLQEN